METHHSIPRSCGGTDDAWNLVEMEAYDHAYKHALDFVLFPNFAPRMDFRMTGWPLLPQELRDAVMLAHSEWMKQKYAEGPFGHQGHSHSEEAKQQISKNRKGKGKKHLSAETRARMSAARRGKPWSAAKRAAQPTKYNKNK